MNIGKFVKPGAAILAGLAANAAFAEQPPPEPPAGAAAEEEPGLRDVEPEAYYVAIVGRPMKIERLDRERFGNLDPWSIASYADFDWNCLRRCREEGPRCWKLCARERQNRDTEDIVISNSCGFIRTTFEDVQLAEADGGAPKFTDRKNFAVYNTVGEWCRLRDRVRDGGEGLLIGKWGQSFYELLHFMPFKGTADGWFVPFHEFQYDNLDLIRDLMAPIEEERQVCFDTNDLHPDDLAFLRNSGLSRPKPGTNDLCETHGLPVSRLPAAYRRLW